MALEKQVRPLFFVSLVIAALGFVGPLVSSQMFAAALDFDLAAQISLFLSAIWLVLFVVAVVQHGTNGLWLLVGAPLALFYPLAFFLVWWACRKGSGCT